VPQRLMTTVAVEPKAIEFAPLPAEADFDTAFDADHKAHAQLLEKGKQRLVGKSAIGSQPDATRFDVLKDQFERPFDHGAFIQMHPAFESILVVSAPVNRDGASTDNQRDGEQVLLIFGRPVDGKADFPERRDLAERLMRDAFGQPFRREPLIVNQSRKPFAGCFLVALGAGQFRLASGLFVKNRRDERDGNDQPLSGDLSGRADKDTRRRLDLYQLDLCGGSDGFIACDRAKRWRDGGVRTSVNWRGRRFDDDR